MTGKKLAGPVKIFVIQQWQRTMYYVDFGLVKTDNSFEISGFL